MNTSPIGLMDSGAGGLTVAAEVVKLLPREDIVYFGDSANCPYGNRPEEEIFSLSCKMVDFLLGRDVKCIGIACNTISTLVNRLRATYPSVRFFSIVEDGSAFTASLGLNSVGLIATRFTVSQGTYDKLIHAANPDCRVFGEGSSNLAGMVEHGAPEESVEAEIKSCVDKILKREAVSHLILGCTHFPIVSHIFEKLYPELKLINPALSQAEAIKAYLEDNNLLNDNGGKMDINSSGNIHELEAILYKLK